MKGLSQSWNPKWTQNLSQRQNQNLKWNQSRSPTQSQSLTRSPSQTLRQKMSLKVCDCPDLVPGWWEDVAQEAEGKPHLTTFPPSSLDS